MEQNPIDEAFILLPMIAPTDYAAYGRRIRAKVLRWVGIPCGVGLAPTKSLAKIAPERFALRNGERPEYAKTPKYKGFYRIGRRERISILRL